MNYPLTVLLAEGPKNTGPDFGKASPVGLLVVVLLLIAVFVLVWSMNRHLKKARDHFAEADGAATAGETKTAADGSGPAAPGGPAAAVDGGGPAATVDGGGPAATREPSGEPGG